MESDLSVQLFKFLIQGVGITLIGTFGICTNILGIVVLTRPKLRSSITWFLLGLSVSDLIFLILCVLIYALVSFFEYLDIADSYQQVMGSQWLITMNDTAQTASVYFTVAIAVERFVIIQWPLSSRSYCTYERCRIYSLVVVGFAILYQLQRLVFTQVKIQIDHKILEAECAHLLPPNKSLGIDEEEELSADDDYEQYFFRWPYMTFMMILPTVILITLNCLIYLALRKRSKKLMDLTSRSSDEKERSITVMLLAVVLVFLICQIVFYVMAILEAFYQCAWEANKFYLIPVDLFLITTNSSVNFLIYCAFGMKFREQLKVLLSRWTGLCPGGKSNRIEMSECTERSTKEDKSSTAL